MSRKLPQFIKQNWIIPLLIIKSIFNSVVQIAWGFVSIGLMGWVFIYISKEYPTVIIPEFMPKFLGILGSFILQNSNLLIWIFTIVYFYFEYMELRKVQRGS